MRRIIKVLLCFLILGTCITACSKKKVTVSEFIKTSYDGYSGFAKVTVSLDKDGLKKSLLESKAVDGDKVDTFVESVELQLKDEYASNGKNVVVSIKCDTSLINKNKIDTSDYKETVSNLKETTELDGFSAFEISLGGASPKITIDAKNISEDEKLKNLKLKMNPEGFYKAGDSVIVSLDIDATAEGMKGFSYKELEREYKIGDVSVFPSGASELQKDVLDEIDKINKETIKKEVSDSTRHMLWRITDNPSYLLESSTENADSIELINTYYLYEKEVQKDRDNNYLLFVYKVEVSNGNSKETGYFVFNYSNAVLVGGKLDVSSESPENRYNCGIDKDAVIKEFVSDKENEYNIETIN